MTDDNVSQEENRQIATLVKEELAGRRISRQYLADQAKLSLSTLANALSGVRPFSLASVVRVEEALEIRLCKLRNARTDKALEPESYGSYSRPAVTWLEGNYATLRSSFSDAASIYVYRTEILWDEVLSQRVFRELDRINAAYKQDGAISVPHHSGYIYVITNKLGQYRLIIRSRPMIGGEMFGLLTTLQSGRSALLSAVATPIVMVPIENLNGESVFGKITSDNKIFTTYQALLKRALEELFVKFGEMTCRLCACA